MIVRILEAARRDLLNGFYFYEEQQAGIGDYFLTTIFTEIQSLKFCGGIHKVKFGSHRMLSEKFPYAIYYRVEGDSILIRAVLDCRRDPTVHRQHLKRPN